MPEVPKKPCTICRRWFRPDPRIGKRQRACDRPECQSARRRKAQASWRRRNPDYAIAWRLDRRNSQTEAPEAMRLPAPLPRLPWELARDEFGTQGADFIVVMSTLILRAAKDEIRRYAIDPAGLPGRLPPASEETSSCLPHTKSRTVDATGVSPTGARWERLRVEHPQRRRRLLASLADNGQQVPIVVVAVEGQTDRYVVIDGYKRIAALEQLGRDTVEAVAWPMSEAAAVLLDRSLRLAEHETALEVGWLLAEMEQRFGYSLEELARRFDRSVSWVSRRLASVELLPEAIQQQVRSGKIGAQLAMKFLAPAARKSLEDCQRMAAIFAEHHCDTRSSGQLYAAWRRGSAAIRQRIFDDPALFFKTQRQETTPAKPAAALMRDLEMAAAIVERAHRRLAGAEALELDAPQRAAARRQIERMEKQLQRLDRKLLSEQTPHVESSATHHDSGTEQAGSGQTGDRAGAGDLARGGAQGPALELQRDAGTATTPTFQLRGILSG